MRRQTKVRHTNTACDHHKLRGSLCQPAAGSPLNPLTPGCSTARLCEARLDVFKKHETKVVIEGLWSVYILALGDVTWLILELQFEKRAIVEACVLPWMGAVKI